MKPSSVPVYVGLGSNLGDRLHNLDQARKEILKTSGVTLGTFSRVYYTEPQGVKEQPWFANQVVQLFCSQARSPLAFVNDLLGIEDFLGRKRNLRWGPRLIDLDLLLWGDAQVDAPGVTVPHPRIGERAFVLIPLLEINPEIVLPKGGRLREQLEKLAYSLEGEIIRQG